MKTIDLSLYLVTDKSDDVEKVLKTIEEAIKGGVSVVQIREKTAETLDFYNLALKVKEITTKYNVPLIINDRVDIALAIDLWNDAVNTYNHNHANSVAVCKDIHELDNEMLTKMRLEKNV